MTAHEPALDGHIFGAGQPCFGCAPDHPFGFRLAFERIESGVSTHFVPDARYQGPPGIMHGGLVVTLADEVAAWAIIAELGKFGFTAEMQARFQKPVRIGLEVAASARLLRSVRGISTVGVSLEQDTKAVFAATMKFAVMDVAGAEALLGGPLPEAWRRFAR